MNDSPLSSLDLTDFPKLLKEVHEFDEPFPWHNRLLGDVVRGGWPQAIAVPTGLGKTCVLDIAIFALALQAHVPPEQRTAPTRTFFIIDRRLVVDDVTAHAERIQRALSAADDKRPAAKCVAERLRVGSKCRAAGLAAALDPPRHHVGDVTSTGVNFSVE